MTSGGCKDCQMVWKSEIPIGIQQNGRPLGAGANSYSRAAKKNVGGALHSLPLGVLGLKVLHEGKPIEALVYIDPVCEKGAPDSIYMKNILNGAKFFKLPKDYILQLENKWRKNIF